eukprot:sb/3466936/
MDIIGKHHHKRKCPSSESRVERSGSVGKDRRLERWNSGKEKRSLERGESVGSSSSKGGAGTKNKAPPGPLSDMQGGQLPTKENGTVSSSTTPSPVCQANLLCANPPLREENDATKANKKARITKPLVDKSKLTFLQILALKREEEEKQVLKKKLDNLEKELTSPLTNRKEGETPGQSSSVVVPPDPLLILDQVDKAKQSVIKEKHKITESPGTAKSVPFKKSKTKPKKIIKESPRKRNIPNKVLLVSTFGNCDISTVEAENRCYTTLKIQGYTFEGVGEEKDESLEDAARRALLMGPFLLTTTIPVPYWKKNRRKK